MGWFSNWFKRLTTKSDTATWCRSSSRGGDNGMSPPMGTGSVVATSGTSGYSHGGGVIHGGHCDSGSFSGSCDAGGGGGTST
jgi:hypothetical protein